MKDAAISLLLATRNAHKGAEIRSILGGGCHYLTLNDFPEAPSVAEDANTFAGNATKKAVELARWLSARKESGRKSNVPCPDLVLADDSGLEVDALNGAPGVHSARFASLDTGKAENAADADNNAKLLRLLEGIPWEKRTARFRCVLAVTPVPGERAANASPVCCAEEAEMETQLFEGACEGRIGFAPRGEGGFGYDPLFVPVSSEQSFAELGEAVKNAISHRSQALKKLSLWLKAFSPGGRGGR